MESPTPLKKIKNKLNHRKLHLVYMQMIYIIILFGNYVSLIKLCSHSLVAN